MAAVTDGTRAAFRRGFADMLPMIPANLAWGLVTGVAMAQSGLGVAKAWGLSLLAYAGSAQLAALPLLVGHAPVWVTVLTALMVNLRFVIYSAALKPALARVPRGRRLALSYLIGDMPFVVFMRSSAAHPRERWPAYFLGIASSNFLWWHVGSCTGLLAAGRIPAAWGLDFAGMVALVALLVPMLASRPGLAACAVAGALSIGLDALPARAGIVVATLAGVGCALLVERLRRVRA